MSQKTAKFTKLEGCFSTMKQNGEILNFTQFDGEICCRFWEVTLLNKQTVLFRYCGNERKMWVMAKPNFNYLAFREKILEKIMKTVDMKDISVN